MAHIWGATYVSSDRVFSCDEDGFNLGQSIPVGAITSPVAVRQLTDPDHRIYVAAMDGTISLFQRDVANPPVTFPLGREMTWSLAHADRVLYVGTGTVVNAQGSVIALDDTTGNFLWVQPLPGPVLYPASIAYRNNRPHRVIVGTAGQDQKIYALDPASGAKGWREPGYAFGQLVEEDILYYADLSGTNSLRARSALDGSPIWEYVNPVNFNFQRPVIAGSVLYVTSVGNQVVAFDAYAGNVLWEATVNGRPGVPVPFFDHSQGVALLIFVSGQYGPENSYLEALDANSGASVWTSTTPVGGPGEACTDPIIGRRPAQVQVGTPTGKLMSFNPYTGQMNWELQLTNSAVSARPKWSPW